MKTDASTSSPTINDEISGDGKMSGADRLRYLWRNALRNMRPRRRTVRADPYHPDTITDAWAVASPSRALALSFLETKLPTVQLKTNLRVLDIGCGSGFMSDTLAALGYGGVYTGIDIGDRFRTNVAHPDAFQRNFVNADAHTFLADEPYDLIISFSALEHIPNDQKLIAHLNTALSEDGTHLHIVPAGWGLPLYLWHGFRQYSLADIEQRFGATDLKIYALGGLFSFMLHFSSITVLEMLLRVPVRRIMPRLYIALHRGCLRLDRVAPIAPASYVICKKITGVHT